MRTWGRVTNALGKRTWVKVETAPDGSEDKVYITTLAQTLLLNLGESPFFGNLGIPAHESVMQQVYPNYYAAYIQRWFAPFFAALTITKVQAPFPKYTVNVTTHQGVRLSASVPIPY